MKLLASLSFPSPAPLFISTFKNGKGCTFFKALGHPALYQQRSSFLNHLHSKKEIALFDPSGFGADTIALLDLKASSLSHVFVHDVEKKGSLIAGLRGYLLSELSHFRGDLLLVADFEASKFFPLVRRFLPPHCDVRDLSSLKLSDESVTNSRLYLDPLNFVTNFAFFKEAEGVHTRLTTVNYWHRYGAQNVRLACILFDQNGIILAEWTFPLEAAQHLIVLDSREIRERFKLPPFIGQLFLHVLGACGHDIFKYALDLYSDDQKTCGSTHDANAWPSTYFAGLPAPHAGEDILLWIQNSHPIPIPSETIHLHLMGQEEILYTLPASVPPFGSIPISIRTVLPDLFWPNQLEVNAGRYCVRPRYEVLHNNRRTIAHMNVEREDLPADPHWRKFSRHFGKGYLLPFPLLSLTHFEQEFLPTPMSRLFQRTALKVTAYTSEGRPFAEKSLGHLSRLHLPALNIREWLGEPSPEGHLELSYDGTRDSDVDGWLHALFRYRDRTTGHLAETSFGCHLFNHPLTYKNEPQSYKGSPPGLSTRLFLRVAPPPLRTFCHLIYPVSQKWNDCSQTTLVGMTPQGEKTTEISLTIPQSGSRLVWIDEIFPTPLQEGFVFVLDPTCRLFGYHGTMVSNQAFSLDHMFGF